LSADRNPKQLVVEGYDDLYSVVELMAAHVPWDDDYKKAPVHIRMGNGASEILEDGYISGLLKMHAIRTLGIMLDADANSIGRYTSIRHLCHPFFPAMPDELPTGGLVVDEGIKRLGVWIMPDNSSEGSLETFLRFLVPNRLEPVWSHAVESTVTAKRIGCECHDAHLDKAHLYTWLAWQDPPGQKPGQALTKKVLDPHAASAVPFVKWFRELYAL
jgi:hypothetical protein